MADDLPFDGKPAKRKLLTASDVRKAISARWAAPEYAVMWEVGRATGAVSGQRYADAVITSLWPSRGLELHGVEIKVSRSDWRRESRNPKKAETIAAYCDRWWVFTTPGIVQDTAELPPAWGLREWDGQRWRTIRDALITDARPCDRTFLASLLRRADGESRWQIDQQARVIADAAVKAAERQIESEIARRSHDRDGAVAALKAFEEASGITLRGFLGQDARKIGEAVKAIHALGLDNAWGGIAGVLKTLKRITGELEGSLDASGLGQVKETAE